jgi:hypothetical protein
MNQRINELVAQSYITERAPSGEGYREFSKEKFAALVVQDCVAICDELMAEYLVCRKGVMDFSDKAVYAEGETACDRVKRRIQKRFDPAVRGEAEH